MKITCVCIFSISLFCCCWYYSICTLYNAVWLIIIIKWCTIRKNMSVNIEFRTVFTYFPTKFYILEYERISRTSFYYQLLHPQIGALNTIFFRRVLSINNYGAFNRKWVMTLIMSLLFIEIKTFSCCCYTTLFVKCIENLKCKLHTINENIEWFLAIEWLSKSKHTKLLWIQNTKSF